MKAFEVVRLVRERVWVLAPDRETAQAMAENPEELPAYALALVRVESVTEDMEGDDDV